MTIAATHVTLIGAGRMGLAMAEGWARDADIGRIDLVDPAPSDQARRLAADPRVRLNPPPAPASALVLAVKPQVFAALAGGLRNWIAPDTLVVSVMAGISIAALSQQLGALRIVRAMPNLPGSIGHGMTGFAAAPTLTAIPDDPSLALARRLLSAIGKVEGPLAEDLMPLVTGVSGSGPAYVFAFTETLAAAGVAAGLAPGLAARLARQTVIGAARLLEAEPDRAPADLRAAVTSPGGTTQAALAVLMDAGALPSLLHETVAAAAARDRELGAQGTAAPEGTKAGRRTDDHDDE